MLLKVKYGRLISKHKYPVPSLTDVDLSFSKEYDKALYGKNLRKELNPSYISTSQQNDVSNIINQFWYVLSKKGFTVSVKDYK